MAEVLAAYEGMRVWKLPRELCQIGKVPLEVFSYLHMPNPMTNSG